MLVPFVPQLRGRRRRTPRTDLLTLIEASFDAGGPWVQLRFNRPIDVGALIGNQIVVIDAPSGTQFEGTAAATLLDPATVQIDMSDIGPVSSPDTRLNASAASGIVGAGDGMPWAGIANLLLPFPS
jgi:hypothetical protein